MSAQAFPLQWPQGRPRTPSAKRKFARFSKKESSGHGWNRTVNLSIADAVRRVIDEAGRIGARGLAISSNLELRNDGLPRSSQRKPDDPGVCVYFDLQGKPMAMPCDTYASVEGNIAAIAAHIEATRAIERHGVATVREMFAGFVALPPPAAEPRKRPWWEVLGVSQSANRINIAAAYRIKAKQCHPDAGGSVEAMAELNAARAEAHALATNP
jgi:hypothetical protein